jgi:DNA recombination protein RmuC
MEVLFFIVGFLVGGIIVWFLLTKRIETQRKEIEKEREEKIKKDAELNSFLRNQEMLDEHLKESIESYVLKAMQLNNENFLNLARQTLEKYFIQADKGLQNKTIEIEKIIAPLKKSIDLYDKKIADFQKDTLTSLGGLKIYLSELVAMQQELSKQTSSLKNALKSTRIRGRWGEIGLRRLVEFTGLNEYCDFDEQSQIGGQRPDLIINLPENRKIIIDSKLPLDAYLSATETDDEVQKNEYLKRHLKAVKENLRLLSSKSYWKNNEESIDFVVMYFQLEPALHAALSQDANLILDALKHKIILATPTTLVALLHTVAYSWKQYQLSENAQLILKEVQDFHSRVSVFLEHFEKIGKASENLTNTYMSAKKSWQSRIVPVLKRLEDLGLRQ